jgi:hypothetical protein
MKILMRIINFLTQQFLLRFDRQDCSRDCNMITGEMYDNHDLHWSARQKSIGVQPQLPLVTTHSKLFTNSRTIMGMEDSQQERHYAEDKIRLRKSSDVSQPHRTAGIVVVDTKSCLIRSSTYSANQGPWMCVGSPCKCISA